VFSSQDISTRSRSVRSSSAVGLESQGEEDYSGVAGKLSEVYHEGLKAMLGSLLMTDDPGDLRHPATNSPKQIGKAFDKNSTDQHSKP